MSTNTQVIPGWIKRFPLVVILLFAVLVISYVLITPLPTIHSGAAVPGNEASILQGRTADTARYNAMAEYYAAKETAARFLTNWPADVARYVTMKEATNIQRSRAADTARYTAMAKYFAAKEVTAHFLTNWTVEVARYAAGKEVASLQRSRAADTARYNAMFVYFAARDAASH